MKCPVCGDVDLVMSDRQGIEIDYCPKCRGVWLDRGELDKIIERSNSPSAPVQQPQYQQRDTKQYSHDSKSKSYRKKSTVGGLLGDLFDF